MSPRLPETLREPGHVLDVLPRDQAGGQPPPARLEPDHRVGRTQRVPGVRAGGPRALLAALHDPDGNTRRHHPRGVGQRLGRHEQRAAGARVGRIPAELADGEAVPVGRYQPDGVVVDLEVYPGDDRQRVVAAGRGHDLADRGGEHAAVDGARQPGQLRQPRVLPDREGHQGEGRRAAGHGHVVFLVSTSTGSGGRLRVISASRRPGTSAVPASATSASRRIRADTS